MICDPSEPTEKEGFEWETTYRQRKWSNVFASGGRPEKLISSRFVHPLLLAAVTPSKEISRSGIAATRKEK